MKNYRVGLYVALTWLLTVAIAYGVGWWAGVKSVARAAGTAAQTSFSLLPGILVLIAVGAAVTAFRVRGYFDHRHTHENQSPFGAR